MTLDEYIKSTDPNIFWRLDSGDYQNLLDEAIERIEELESQRSDEKESCHNCKFGGKYVCQRHAPVYVVGEVNGKFPFIFNGGFGMWCGDWEKELTENK